MILLTALLRLLRRPPVVLESDAPVPDTIAPPSSLRLRPVALPEVRAYMMLAGRCPKDVS